MIKKFSLALCVYCLVVTAAFAQGIDASVLSGKWGMDVEETMKPMHAVMREELGKNSGFLNDSKSILEVVAQSGSDSVTVKIAPKGDAGAAGKKWPGSYTLRLEKGLKGDEYQIFIGQGKPVKVRVSNNNTKAIVFKPGAEYGIVLKKLP